MNQLKKIIFFRNGLVWYIVLIGGINIFFLQFSLLNVFGYEFSVINSILLALLSGIHTIGFLKQKLIEKEYSLKILFENLLLFILTPLFISLAASFLNGFCSFIDGLLFYLIILCPSVIVGAGLAVISILISKKFSIIIFLFAYLIVLSIPIFEIYLNPQVYFYNPIAAFFPGNIYDEGLTVSNKLILYRIFNVLYFGTIIFMFIKYAFKLNFSKKIIFLGSALSMAFVFIYFSSVIGFSTTKNSLQSHLVFQIETEHFFIMYAPTLDSNEVKLLAVRHELYFNELKKYFNYAPNKKINSFIYDSVEQKKKIFGAGNADVAKPWLGQIYLTYDNYNRTLKHELAHCFSQEFGTSIFKVAENFNAAMIEGLAVAADPFYDEYPVDFMAAVAFQNGYKINLKSLFESFNFFFQASSLSYIYSGSFSKFLIDNYGISKFKKLYSNLDFQLIYNTTAEKLIDKYYKMLSDYDLTNKKAMADFYFGRKPIFTKVCPRFISDRLQKAWGHFQNHDYSEAIDLFKTVLDKTENYSAVIGYASCLFEMNKQNSAVKFLKANINQFDGTSNYFQMKFMLADFLAEMQQVDLAHTLYDEIIDSSPNRVLMYLSEVRNSLITNGGILPEYLAATDTIKYKLIKKINQEKYNYYTFPVMISLSISAGERYTDFIKNFNGSFLNDGGFHSYGLFKLSNYMFENLDFVNARKTASLALRYASTEEEKLIQNYFQEVDWTLRNSNNIVKSINWNNSSANAYEN